ncbi:MAG: IS5 family transposase [Pseudomonadota bacterium]
MSDAEWAFFEPFIVAVRQPNGRRPVDHRRVLDGIFWIARTGAPWRDLPDEFGKWGSVYRQFRRWTLAGLWETILEVLNDSEAVPDAVQMVDSTIIRAHHCATGARGGPQSQNLGRSKGGFTTKIHLRTNAAGLPTKAAITAGQASDYAGYADTIDADLPPARVLIADKGYDSDAIRDGVEAAGGTPVIPARRTRKAPVAVDGFIYALRNRIERCINRLKNARRLATRYDKTAASYLGFIEITAARLWFRHLST